MQQVVKIEHHGRCIDGTLYLPEKKKCPVVIFSHGYNGHKSDFDYTTNFLTEKNIAAFCYTFCGGSTRDESGFLTTDMTIFSEMEDLQAVINKVRELEEINAEQIFVFGGSQGGLVTALTVDEMWQEIKGMVLLYPAFCIADNWNQRFQKKEEIPEELEFWGMKLGRTFFETLQGFDVFSHIGKYKNKILVMHGDKDPIVDLEYSNRIKDSYPQVRLEVFKGEGHGFTDIGTEKMTEMLYQFILENL